MQFLLDVSTLSFWLEHKGAWYVAMLIPVYLLFPWFYDWAERKNRKMRVLGSLSVTVAVSFLCSIASPNLYDHLSQVFSSMIVYLIGYYYAGLNEDEGKSGLILSLACLLLYAVKAITPLKKLSFVSNLTWSMLGIPFAFISTELLYKMNNRIINAFLGFFGKYSLEMYLWNIFVIQALKAFNVIGILKENGDTYGVASYGLIVVLGCLLSVVYGKLSGRISQKIVQKKY